MSQEAAMNIENSLDAPTTITTTVLLSILAYLGRAGLPERIKVSTSWQTPQQAGTLSTRVPEGLVPSPGPA